MPATPHPVPSLVRLTADDWRLWRAVRLEALADAPEAFGSTLAQWQGAGDTEQRWRGRLVDVPFNVVAVVDGRGVGQVSATAVAADGSVELLSMWVAPEVRRHGTALRFIEAVVDWAHDQGAATVVLSMRRGNDRALAFYRRAEFTMSDDGDAGAEHTMRLPLNGRGTGDAVTRAEG